MYAYEPRKHFTLIRGKSRREVLRGAVFSIPDGPSDTAHFKPRQHLAVSIAILRPAHSQQCIAAHSIFHDANYIAISDYWLR